jgi:hypothetical protein
VGPRGTPARVRRLPAAALLLSGAACVPSNPATPMPIDLLRELPRAAVAPAARPNLVSVQVVDRDGAQHAALVMHPTSRAIWQVQMTEPAELRADIARLPGGDAGAELFVRIGMSDERIYEGHFRERLPHPAGEAPAWRPLVLDLSLYSGWKWSLFYQPSRRTWSLVLNVEGGDAAVALVEPVIAAR